MRPPRERPSTSVLIANRRRRRERPKFGGSWRLFRGALFSTHNAGVISRLSSRTSAVGNNRHPACELLEESQTAGGNLTGLQRPLESLTLAISRAMVDASVNRISLQPSKR